MVCGSISNRGKRFFSLKHPDPLWGPLILLVSGYYSLFPKGDQGVMLTTHLRVVPRLRMSGAVPLLPQYAFLAWMGKTLSYLVDVMHGNKKNWSSRKPCVPSILKYKSHASNCLSFSTIYLVLWVWYVKLNGTCDVSQAVTIKITVLCRGSQIFQNSRSYLSILGLRRVTRSKFQTEDPQILGIKV